MRRKLSSIFALSDMVRARIRRSQGRLYFLCLLLVSLCAARAAADIGIIVALDDQARAAESLCIPAGQPTREAGRVFHYAFYKGTRVHIVKSGAGLVPTAQTASLLLARYPIHCVISYGLAGCLLEEAPTGDLFIARQALAHNGGIARDFGAVRGQPAGFESAKKPSAAYAQKNAALCAALAAGLAKAGVAFTSGTLVCGDEFIASPRRKAELREQFNAAAVDMNATGVTLPCASYEIPCLLARRFTDAADAQAGLDFSRSSRAKPSENDKKILSLMLELALKE